MTWKFSITTVIDFIIVILTQNILLFVLFLNTICVFTYAINKHSVELTLFRFRSRDINSIELNAAI